MELKEALKLVSESKMFIGKQVVNGIEYDSYFVFDCRKNPNKDEYDSLIGVKKSDKKVCVFSPLMISRKELGRGKEIPQNMLRIGGM